MNDQAFSLIVAAIMTAMLYLFIKAFINHARYERMKRRLHRVETRCNDTSDTNNNPHYKSNG